MLLRFHVQNFRSFGEGTEINTLPYAKLRTHRNHLYERDNFQLLKTTMLYGANGSGKSNFTRGLYTLQSIICDGIVDSDALTPFLLLEKFEDVTTDFEIEFVINEQYYLYTLSVLRTLVIEEALYRTDPKLETERQLFERTFDPETETTSIDAAPELVNSERDRIKLEVYQQSVLEPDVPLLHLIGTKDIFPDLVEAYTWFDTYLHVIFPESRYVGLLESMLVDSTFADFINRILPKLDTGLERLEVIATPLDKFVFPAGDDYREKVETQLADPRNKFVGLFPFERLTPYLIRRDESGEAMVYRLNTLHNCRKGDVRFRLDQESDGTLRLLDLLPAIRHLIADERVIVVDEIGRSLHPLLLREFLAKFLNESTKGQLLFTTHDTSLLTLELFRRDEIWMVEKDNCGQSKFHSLSDFKIRHDKDIRRDYLNGRFGGIPSLNGLRYQKWTDAETTL